MSGDGRKQLQRFLMVGGTTVFIDFAIYCLGFSCGLDKSVAKSIAFLVGTVFAYFANKAWTFEAEKHTGGGVSLFILVYSVTLLVNVAVNALFLWALDGFPLKIVIAFVIATGTSATLNFLGMKYIVFAKPASSASSVEA